MSQRPVVVLDLDGVIVQTNFIKHKAMLAMFAAYPDKCTTIDAYILANGGVARRDKLIAILETIIGVEATTERLAQYLDRYANNLEASLAVAQLVTGVKAFIVRRDYAFYISSTAPDKEVREQLARHSLDHYFIDVYGGCTPKVRALTEISKRHATASIVFFGDSLGDLVAARQAGVAFVGVTNERDNFKDLNMVKLEDFGSPEIVDHALRAAIRMRIDESI